VPPEVADAFDALNAAVATIGELKLDNYHPGVRLYALERLENAGAPPGPQTNAPAAQLTSRYIHEQRCISDIGHATKHQ
jgi:hypothetical protein